MGIIERLREQVQSLNVDCIDEAKAYQNTLTKPPGSLGRLEDLGVAFSAYQGVLKPVLKKPFIAIMASDHGVAEEGVSAFPQAVTAEMVKNFSRKGAAITVLAESIGASFQVVNLGTIQPLDALDAVLDKRIAAGTRNICHEAAMTDKEFESAVLAGFEVIDKAFAEGMDVFIGGEMGIANTTSAACIATRLLAKYPSQIVGPGTGLDLQGVDHKIQVVERALVKHPVQEPVEVLRCLGGFEIVALVAAYIRCAQLGVPIILDGYITTSAALVAVALNPEVKNWMIASHQSAEPAHAMMLESLGLEPVLQLGMRLGEGSGAAIAYQIIQSACLLQSEMASFAEAGVSEKAE